MATPSRGGQYAVEVRAEFERLRAELEGLASARWTIRRCRACGIDRPFELSESHMACVGCRAAGRKQALRGENAALRRRVEELEAALSALPGGVRFCEGRASCALCHRPIPYRHGEGAPPPCQSTACVAVRRALHAGAAGGEGR